jgi:hypothetical protein
VREGNEHMKRKQKQHVIKDGTMKKKEEHL